MHDDLQLEAETLRVEQLVAHVNDGRVRIPSFQRPLKWRPKDVRDLFDSLFRGFPIGSLLFWRLASDAERVTLGPVTLPVCTERSSEERGSWNTFGASC